MSIQKEKFWYFFEVDLPLLDAHLILREEMEIVREEFAKTGTELPVEDVDKKQKARTFASVKNEQTARPSFSKQY